jgi:hypothetical protein
MYQLNPRAIPIMFCLSVAIVFWNNDTLFWLFGLLALMTAALEERS